MGLNIDADPRNADWLHRRPAVSRRCRSCGRTWRGEVAIRRAFYPSVVAYCRGCHQAHEAMRNDLEARTGAPALGVPTVARRYATALRLGYARGLSGTELGHWMAAEWRKYGRAADRTP